MKYETAPEIKEQIDYLIKHLEFDYIKAENIHCIRSFDAQTRAYARIWGMAKLFKEVAGIEPHYIIEVNAKKFDKLSDREKMKNQPFCLNLFVVKKLFVCLNSKLSILHSSDIFCIHC